MRGEKGKDDMQQKSPAVLNLVPQLSCSSKTCQLNHPCVILITVYSFKVSILKASALTIFSQRQHSLVMHEAL